MQKVYLKSMLLLCALIVGSNAWATDLISWTARTAANGTDTYTTGYTYSSNKITGKAGYVQDSGTKDETIISMTLFKTDEALFASAPVEITFSANLGGGSTKDPLDYNVYACFVDNTGADISGSAVIVTTKITSTTGSNFSVNMPTSYATSAYGIKIYHMKEDGWNVRYYSFTLSYSNQATPTWSLNPETAQVSIGQSTILDLTTNYDGTLSFESEDEDVATVSYDPSTKKVTVNGIAIGTTTINATGDATANYQAISKTINVVVKKALAANCIMYDSFDENDEVGGNDGTWKNITSTPTPLFDLPGWTYETAYGASRCVRIGKNGYFLSPALGVAGNVTLKFKTESWGTDGSNGYVDIVGDGTFDDSESISGVNFAANNTRAQVTLTKNGTWTEYTLSIIGVTSGSKIKFSGPTDKRIFFDDFEVLLDKYDMAVGTTGWASLYLPCNVVVPTGATAYYASEVVDDEITLNPVPEIGGIYIIPAKQGVLINAATGSYSFNYTATETEILSLFGGVTTDTNVDDLDPAVPSGSSLYVLGVDAENHLGFYPFDGTLTAYKAYLITTTVTGAPSIRFEIDDENNTTNLDEINANDKVMKFFKNGQLLIKRDGITYDALGHVVR